MRLLSTSPKLAREPLDLAARRRELPRPQLGGDLRATRLGQPGHCRLRVAGGAAVRLSRQRPPGEQQQREPDAAPCAAPDPPAPCCPSLTHLRRI